MRESRLILVGGGGHCKAVIDVVRSSGRSIYGILDNSLPVGSDVLGIPVVGNDNDIPSLANEDTEFLITVGQIKSSSIRHNIANAIVTAGGKLANPIIASTAHIALGAKIGKGTVIMHNAVVNSDAVIGENVIVNTAAVVEHDCRISDFVHISTGAIVNGCSTIGNNCFIGSHATIANVKTVVSDTIIGAGAVVVNDITIPGTYCGIPAHPVK